jgi:hypothetical protein
MSLILELADLWKYCGTLDTLQCCFDDRVC